MVKATWIAVGLLLVAGSGSAAWGLTKPIPKPPAADVRLRLADPAELSIETLDIPVTFEGTANDYLSLVAHCEGEGSAQPNGPWFQQSPPAGLRFLEGIACTVGGKSVPVVRVDVLLPKTTRTLIVSGRNGAVDLYRTNLRKLHVSVENGEVHVADRVREATLKSKGGQISVEGLRALPNLNIETVSGHVILETPRKPDLKLTYSTKTGRQTILPEWGALRATKNAAQVLVRTTSGNLDVRGVSP